MQGHQLGIGLVCETSLASHVDDHDTLFPFRQGSQPGQVVAVDVHSWHVVKRLLDGCRLSELVFASLEDHACDYRLSHGDRLIFF